MFPCMPHTGVMDYDEACMIHLYFTTKHLLEQYMVSSGQNRWLYCPLVPEGSIKLSVMPAGKKNEKKCSSSLNLTDFNKLVF